MKNKKIPVWIWVSALLGIGMATLTSWLIHLYIQQQVLEQPRLPALPIEKKEVLVANYTLNAGTEISLDSLALRALAVDALPTDSLTAETIDFILGQNVIVDIEAGKALQVLHLQPPHSLPLSKQLKANHTAFTLPIDNDWGHAQSIQEGDVFGFYKIQQNTWTQLYPAVPLISLAPKHLDTDYNVSNTHLYQYATFEVPTLDYANLYQLYHQDKLRIVLQGEKTQQYPEQLKGEKTWELIVPFQAQHSEGWP